MQELFIFQRRNRLKRHFINTSNVLLYGYQSVSDAAKITFQIIDGFDWESKETGESKGYVFPAVETLARIRNTSVRTIQRHILELITANLLTRIRRRNQPSILFIEDVSEKEIKQYLHLFDGKSYDKSLVRKEITFRNDKNVISPKAPETTKMSFAYKNKKDERKENEINVNEDFNKNRVENGMMSLQRVLQRYDIDKHIQPKSKTISIKITPENRTKRDYYAQEIADTLGDQKSLGCFRTIAEKVPEGVIFQTLASIKETWREGKIKQSRGALFVDIIKQYSQKHGIALNFTTT